MTQKPRALHMVKPPPIAEHIRKRQRHTDNPAYRIRELYTAIYLYLFCRWNWRGARRYARLLADCHRQHLNP